MDDYDINLDFERGDCSILALRLQELTKRPLIGMFDKGELHHVAVDMGRGLVLDVRGVNDRRMRAEDAGRPNAVWKRIKSNDLKKYGLPDWDSYDEDELDVVDDVAAELAQ